MATNDIGRVTPIWRGFYSAATAYELNDIVIDAGGSVWWHKGHDITTGTAPAEGDVWGAVIDMGVFGADIQAAIETAQAAVAAAEAAESGVAGDVRRAETAADNAEQSAVSAASSAAGVGAYAQAAEAAKTAAQAAQAGAETAQSGAETARTGAEAAQTAAETAKTGAQTAKTGAETAQAGAQTAKTGAETARAGAETAAASAAASAASAAEAALTGNLAPVYSPLDTYRLGAMVLHDGTLCECVEAIDAPEEWTAAHWRAVKLAPEVADVKKIVNDADIRIVRDFPVQTGYITSAGTWGSMTTNNLTAFLPVQPGDKLTMTARAGQSAVIAVLTGLPTFASGGAVPFSAASGWTARKTVADTTVSYVMPADAVYFAFTTLVSRNDTSPLKLEVNGMDYVKPIRESVKALSLRLDGEAERLDGEIGALGAEMDLQYTRTPSVFWSQGAVSASNGTDTASDTRLRTKGTLADVAEICADDGYKYMIFAYTDASAYKDSNLVTYIGVWNGTGFAKSGSWRTGVTDLRAVGSHYYRIVLAEAADSAITPEGGTHLRITAARPRAITALPALELEGDASAMTKDNAVNLTGRIFGQTGTCKMKWQGSSSIAYPKKNYKITFDTGFEGFDAWQRWRKFQSSYRASTGDTSTQPSTASRWGVQTKYVAKANWVDPSAARNIVCARLWGQIVKSRVDAGDITDKRADAPNYGAIDGFPFEIKFNGASNGLYTMTIPKEGWMFAMSGNAPEYLVSSESSNLNECKWLAAPVFGEVTQGALTDTDFKIEYDGAEDDVALKTSFAAAVGAAMGASGANWQAAVAPYVDIGSAMDYYIFACCVNHSDGMPHNIIYGSYDGTRWFFSAYDLDSTFGVDAYGSAWSEVWPALAADVGRRCQFRYGADQHKIFKLIYQNNKAELKARYQQLRAGVLSDENVWHELSRYIVDIPARDYDADRTIWPDEPGTATATLEQYMQFYRMHCARLDAEVEAMS